MSEMVSELFGWHFFHSKVEENELNFFYFYLRSYTSTNILEAKCKINHQLLFQIIDNFSKNECRTLHHQTHKNQWRIPVYSGPNCRRKNQEVWLLVTKTRQSHSKFFNGKSHVYFKESSIQRIIYFL